MSPHAISVKTFDDFHEVEILRFPEETVLPRIFRAAKNALCLTRETSEGKPPHAILVKLLIFGDKSKDWARPDSNR